MIYYCIKKYHQLTGGIFLAFFKKRSSNILIVVRAIELVNLKSNTFYRRVNEYESIRK